MTIAFDHRNKMNLLAKVARGLDLPAPGVSTPPQPAAPLTDEETVVDPRMDQDIESAASATAAVGNESVPARTQRPLEILHADHDSGSASSRLAAVSDPAASADTLASGDESADRPGAANAETESVPSELLPADRSAAKSSPRQFSQADSRTGNTTVAETTAPDPARPFETSADTTTDHSDTGSPLITQPGSPEAAAGLKRSIPRGPTETPRRPGHPPADAKDPAPAENGVNPGTRWQLYRAGGPESKVSRQTSRMLQPVFDIPEQVGAPKPDDIRKRENPIARDRAPAADPQPGRTQGPARVAGDEMANLPSQHQPAGRSDKREPVGNHQAILSLNGSSPPANRPPPSANHDVAASNRQRPNRRPDRNAASVRQVVPGETRARGGPDRPAGAAAVQERPGAKAGGVSVGKINIQVQGQRQTEDDWPAPPQYTSHSITADWEWSCHYGR